MREQSRTCPPEEIVLIERLKEFEFEVSSDRCDKASQKKDAMWNVETT